MHFQYFRRFLGVVIAKEQKKIEDPSNENQESFKVVKIGSSQLLRYQKEKISAYVSLIEGPP